MHKVVIYPASEEENIVINLYKKLGVSTRRKIIKVLKYLQIYGISKDIQDIKKLRGYDFWEVRILGKDNIRLFVVEYKSIIFVLHIFRKKSQTTSPRDLNLANKRLKAIALEY